MKTLAHIGKIPKDIKNVRKREAARAIMFDSKGLIPLLYVGKYNYHKLPGGGIKSNENIETALHRECIEEVGSTIEIIEEVGTITEYRDDWNLYQTSYCFVAKVLEKGDTDFTQSEIDDEFSLIWTDLNDAISRLENDKPDSYEGKFIKSRDLTFILAAKDNISKYLNHNNGHQLT